MKIPKSFNEITVRQYQSIHDLIIDETLEIEDREVRILAELTGKSIDEIESLPLDELKMSLLQLEFLKRPDLSTKYKKWFTVNGRVYKAKPFAQKLSTGQYVDLKSFHARGSVSTELHNLLACVYEPLRVFKRFVYNADEHEKMAKDMLDAKMSDVYGTLFFYSIVWENWSDVMLDYSKQANQTIVEMMKEIKESGLITQADLDSIGVGWS